MHPNFSAHGQQHFLSSTSLPDNYRGLILRGGDIETAYDPSVGTIVLQHFETTRFNIDFNVYDFLRPIRLVCQQNKAMLVSFLAFKNNIRFAVKGINSFKLKQGQFALLHNAREQEVLISFEKNKSYQSLEVSWSAEYLENFLPSFNLLEPILSPLNIAKSFFIQAAGREAGYRGLDLALDILKSPYDDRSSRFYFESKVYEYLLWMLVETSEKEPPKVRLTTAERNKILEIGDRLINEQGKEFTIASLARSAGINEMKLKMAFKEMHGNSIFQYQMDARMREAHRLLQEGILSTKEVAALIGYKRTTSFIEKFSDYFKYPPSTITKRK